MASPKKSINDQATGETMLTEIFKVVERLNAIAGPGMAEKGAKSGTMTFNPKIVVDEAGDKQYTCYVDIYTPDGADDGPEMSMEWSGATIEQFKQALAIATQALSGLAKETYLAETYTVGLVKPDGEEVEIYAPEILEPGIYSIKED
jgi:hypothetical protein